MIDDVVASKTNPVYSVHIKTDEYDSVNVHNVVTGLKLSELKNQIAQKADVTLMNVADENGRYLEDYLSVMNRVYIYANDGETIDEVFQGWVWRKGYTNDKKKYITLVCYDNLIYLMRNEESDYIPAGDKTDNICQKMCDKRGIPLVFDYGTIEHKKLKVSGKLSNFIVDVLDKAKRKLKRKYVVRSEKGTCYIKYAGSNQKIYEIKRKENAISSSSELSMDNVITQVIIVGKAEDEESAPPIERTLTGDTDKYGVLQKVIRKSSDDEDDTSDEDAEWYLDEYGKPKLEFDTTAIDIPFLHKGDKVRVVAGDIDLFYIVLSVVHNALTKTMNITAERTDEDEQTQKSNGGSGEIFAGKEIYLDYAPIYVSSDATSIAGRLTGTYYVYDGIDFSGRYRITDSPDNVGARPINSYVTGWLDKEYIV